MGILIFLGELLIGGIAGFSLCLIIFEIDIKGIIEIDQSGEKDKYLFVFTAPTEDIPKSKYVIFKTRNVTELVKKQKDEDALYYKSLMKGEENE